MKKQWLALVLFVLISVVIFSSCSNKAPSVSLNGDSAIVDRGDYMYSENADEATDVLGAEVTATSDRKIIVRSNYTIETQDIDKSINTLEAAVAEIGGYYETSRVDGRTETGGEAEYVVRVPSDKLNDFAQNISTLGNVVSQTRSGEDVTTQYFDTETELSSLKIQQERLLKLLEKAESLDDILKLEAELTDVRTQIESLTTTLKKYDNLIDYSTVTIYILQVDVYTEPEAESLWGQITSAFQKSFAFAGEVAKTVLLAAIWTLPYILVAGAVLVVVVLFIRRRKRNR